MVVGAAVGAAVVVVVEALHVPGNSSTLKTDAMSVETEDTMPMTATSIAAEGQRDQGGFCAVLNICL